MMTSEGGRDMSAPAEGTAPAPSAGVRAELDQAVRIVKALVIRLGGEVTLTDEGLADADAWAMRVMYRVPGERTIRMEPGSGRG
jgi:hypothetical protein